MTRRPVWTQLAAIEDALEKSVDRPQLAATEHALEESLDRRAGRR